MKRFVTLIVVFTLGFAACWLVKGSKRSASTGEPTSVCRVEVTVPPGNPDRDCSHTYNATVTVVRDGEDEHIIATGETDKPPMKIVLIDRDGRRVAFIGHGEPK